MKPTPLYRGAAAVTGGLCAIATIWFMYYTAPFDEFGVPVGWYSMSLRLFACLLLTVCCRVLAFSDRWWSLVLEVGCGAAVVLLAEGAMWIICRVLVGS